MAIAAGTHYREANSAGELSAILGQIGREVGQLEPSSIVPSSIASSWAQTELRGKVFNVLGILLPLLIIVWGICLPLAVSR